MNPLLSSSLSGGCSACSASHESRPLEWNVGGIGSRPGTDPKVSEPPAGPLNVSRLQASVHQPLAPVELRMGRIHKHCVDIINEAVDGSMEMGLHFRPGPWTLGPPIAVPSERHCQSPVQGEVERGSRRVRTFRCPVGRSRDGPVAVVQATNRL